MEKETGSDRADGDDRTNHAQWQLQINQQSLFHIISHFANIYVCIFVYINRYAVQKIDKLTEFHRIHFIGGI